MDDENLDYRPEDEVDNDIPESNDSSYEESQDDSTIENLESDDGFSNSVKDKTTTVRKRITNEATKRAANKISEKVTDDTLKRVIQKMWGGKVISLSGLAPFILAVLFFIWLIGIIFAFAYLPALTKDGIKRVFTGVLRTFNSWFIGENAAKVDKERIRDIATYARKMGFNLYGEGFIYDKIKQEDISEDTVYVENEGISIRKDNGRVQDMVFDNSVLRNYCLMDAYTYSIEGKRGLQDILKISDIAETLKKFFNSSHIKDADKFDGMIRIEQVEGTDITKVNDKNPNYVSADLNPDKRTLSLKAGRFKTRYVYNIDGWSGRYGMPIEFLLALHKSLMAPDLIRELTSGTKIENDRYLKTKMLLRLVTSDNASVEGVIRIPNDTSINGKLYDSSGREVTNIDFEGALNGNVIYYAKATILGADRFFPLKTTGGKVKYKLPQNYNYVDYIPERGSEYDITESYIDFETKKVRSISGETVGLDEVKQIIEKLDDSAFVVNFGLHSLAARFSKDNKIQGMLGGSNFNKTIKGAVDALSDKKYKAFLPVIYRVENHWFRDIFFYMKEGEKYAKLDEDYFIKKGEFWSKYKKENGKEVVDYQTVSGKDWCAYKIEKLSEDEIQETLSKYESNEDDPKDVKAIAELGDILYVKERFDIKATQLEDGRRGETNPRTKKLLAEDKWYVYDGTTETADKINKQREESKDSDKYKSRISKNSGLLAGGLILEQMESIDAEMAYRDYKELLLELNYFSKDDLSPRVRKVMQYIIPEALPGDLWPNLELTKDENEFGTKILSEKTIKEVKEKYLVNDSGGELSDEDKKIKEEQFLKEYGEGFKNGAKVVSPVTGKVIKKEGNLIEIQVLNDIDNVKEYKDFYDDEYKGCIGGYKVTIRGLASVGITNESKYEKQIPDKLLSKITEESQRKKVEEVEKRKFDAPPTVGEYIKEGTVIGTAGTEDIVISMKTFDDTIVEHIDKYMIIPKSEVLDVETGEDYFTKIVPGGKNQLASQGPSTQSVETFKTMFRNYPVLVQHAEAFIKMQETYGVNAIFAAAVSIAESSGGTNWSAIPRETHNMFSVTGTGSGKYHTGVTSSSSGSSNPRKWRVYKNFDDAIMDFGYLIAEGDYYFKQNKFTVREIAKTYVGHEAGPWVNTVIRVMTNALSDAKNLTPEQRKKFDKQIKDANFNVQSGKIGDGLSEDVLSHSKAYFDILRAFGTGSSGGITDPGIPGTGSYKGQKLITEDDINKIPNSSFGALSKSEFARLVAEAQKHLGKPYVFGSNGPNSFDCSSYVCWVLRNSGIKPNAYRTTAHGIYYNYCTPVKAADARPGDIIFAQYTYDSCPTPISHVGIYLGGGRIIHAGNPISYSNVNDPLWKNHGMLFGRIKK